MVLLALACAPHAASFQLAASTSRVSTSTSSRFTMNAEVPARWRSVAKGGENPLQRSMKPDVTGAAREISSWTELLDTDVKPNPPELRKAHKATKKTRKKQQQQKKHMKEEVRATTNAQAPPTSDLKERGFDEDVVDAMVKAGEVSVKAVGAVALLGSALFNLGVDQAKVIMADRAKKKLVARLTEAEKSELILAKLADGTPITEDDIILILDGPPEVELPALPPAA